MSDTQRFTVQHSTEFRSSGAWYVFGPDGGIVSIALTTKEAAQPLCDRFNGFLDDANAEAAEELERLRGVEEKLRRVREHWIGGVQEADTPWRRGMCELLNDDEPLREAAEQGGAA